MQFLWYGSIDSQNMVQKTTIFNISIDSYVMFVSYSLKIHHVILLPWCWTSQMSQPDLLKFCDYFATQKINNSGKKSIDIRYIVPGHSTNIFEKMRMWITKFTFKRWIKKELEIKIVGSHIIWVYFRST